MKYERGSFITVPSRDKLRGMHPTAQALYMWLCSYANETGNCFPSRSTLAEDVGCSESMVDNMLLSLEKEGLLKRKARKEGDRQLSNMYTVLVCTLPHSGTPPSTEYATPSHDVRTNSIQGTKPIEVVVETTDGDFRSKSPKKVTAGIQSVFDIFEDNPARFVWKGRVHQREAAQVLHNEFGIPTLEARYKLSKKYKGEQGCPQIDNPSDFLEKMPKMEYFLNSLKV